MTRQLLTWLAATFITVFLPLSANAQHRSAQSLTVLAWNIFLLPDLLVLDEAKLARAAQAAQRLKTSDADVLVLSELFHDAASLLVLDQLKESYPFRTGVLAAAHSPFVAGRLTFESGGVVILSRHPLEGIAETVYSQAAGLDRFTRKGALYAQVNKNGKRYHVFATHTQANKSNHAVRRSQFEELSAFMTSRRISADEPVILAGDLNVDFFETGKFEDVMGLLGTTSLAFQKGEQPEFTYSPDLNPLAAVAYTKNELLDYVLHSGRHQGPCREMLVTLPMALSKDDALDTQVFLSDHFAVKNTLEFGAGPCRE